MSIEIPNLDDLTYQQLVDNLVRSIPQYSSQWTDYNPSDPGIAILEMLSWISQSLLYRANNISDESYRNYLKLIAGDHVYEPEDHLHTELLNELKNWSTPQSAEGLATIISKVQAYWSTSNRVIAEVDYYALSLEAYYMECARQLGKPFNSQIRYRQQSLSHLKQLRRIFVNAEVVLEHDSKVKRIEVIVNTAPDPRERAPSVQTNAYNSSGSSSDSNSGKQQTNQPFEPAIKPMLRAIKSFIVPRRPVGTLLSVRQVDNTNIDLAVSLVFASSSQQSVVTDAIDKQVARYVNAFTGGRDNSGWPLGEALVSSDLVRLIGEVNGVAGVTNIQLNDYVVLIRRKQETPDDEIPKGGLQIYYKPSPAAVSQNINKDTEKGAGSDSGPWSLLVKPAEFESFQSELSTMVKDTAKAVKVLKHQLKLLNSEPNTPQSAEQKQKLEAELAAKTAKLSSLESLQKKVKAIWKQASEKASQQEKQSDQGHNNPLTQAPTVAQTSLFITGKNVSFSFLNIRELIGKTQILYPRPQLTGKHNES